MSDLPAKTVHDIALARHGADDVTPNPTRTQTDVAAKYVHAASLENSEQRLTTPTPTGQSNGASFPATDVTTQPDGGFSVNDCDMNFDLVQQILNKTSQTVSDLDSFLGDKRD